MRRGIAAAAARFPDRTHHPSRTSKRDGRVLLEPKTEVRIVLVYKKCEAAFLTKVACNPFSVRRRLTPSSLNPPHWFFFFFFFLSLFLRKMKLLTHNMLSCHIKGIRNGFPFIIEVTKTETVDADYNPGAQDNVIFSSLHATAVITQDRQRLSLMHDRVSETYFPSDSLVSLLSGGKTGQSWEISGKCSTLLLQDWLDFHYCMYGS